LIVSISGCKYNHNFKLSKEKFKKITTDFCTFGFYQKQIHGQHKKLRSTKQRTFYQ
jgi:hypothetical protein